ncbi:hypothetical protein FKG94_28230 [Exilibacterium tricleocarpae]|uniref:Nucleotidyltransferase domain-containing protein n=1 Tax=Exilibacterium tricleocarpae TaxID=2591008 RepID=A0A545SL30_9GAMM|nr:hypothetical protein FKG94_28230 [Exilibacterium tricleocarpae]
MVIYGFGSYFASTKHYRDIDFLIVHDSISNASCQKAINFKKLILKEIDGASVTILSKSSEKNFDFISVSEAVLLGVVDEDESEPSIEEIANKTKWFRLT